MAFFPYMLRVIMERHIDSNNYFVEQLEIFLACTSFLLQDNCVELSFLARISSTANPFFITVVKVVMHLELSSVEGLASASIFTVAAKFQNQAQSWIPHEKLHGACVFLDYFFQKISE